MLMEIEPTLSPTGVSTQTTTAPNTRSSSSSSLAAPVSSWSDVRLRLAARTVRWRDRAQARALADPTGEIQRLCRGMDVSSRLADAEDRREVTLGWRRICSGRTTAWKSARAAAVREAARRCTERSLSERFAGSARLVASSNDNKLEFARVSAVRREQATLRRSSAALQTIVNLESRCAGAFERRAASLARRSAAAGATARRSSRVASAVSLSQTNKANALRASIEARASYASARRSFIESRRSAKIAEANLNRLRTRSRASALKTETSELQTVARLEAAESRRVARIASQTEARRAAALAAQSRRASAAEAVEAKAVALADRLRKAEERRLALLASRSFSASPKPALERAFHRRTASIDAIRESFSVAEATRLDAEMRRAAELEARREKARRSYALPAPMIDDDEATPYVDLAQAQTEAAERRQSVLASVVATARVSGRRVLAAASRRGLRAVQREMRAELDAAHATAVGARKSVRDADRAEVARALGSERVVQASCRLDALVAAKAVVVGASTAAKQAAALRRRRSALAAKRRAGRKASSSRACFDQGVILGCQGAVHSPGAELDARLSRGTDRREAVLARRGAVARAMSQGRGHFDKAEEWLKDAKHAAVSEATLLFRQRLAADRRALGLWIKARQAKAMSGRNGTAALQANLEAGAMLQQEAHFARVDLATARRDDHLTEVFSVAHEMGTKRLFNALRRRAATEYVAIKRSAHKHAIAHARRCWQWTATANKAFDMGSGRVVAAAARRTALREAVLDNAVSRAMCRRDASERRSVGLIRQAGTAAFMAVPKGPSAKALGSGSCRPRRVSFSEAPPVLISGNLFPGLGGSIDDLPVSSVVALPVESDVDVASVDVDEASETEAKALKLQRKLDRAEANRKAIEARAGRGARTWRRRSAAAASRRCMSRVSRVARSLKAESRALDAERQRATLLALRAETAARLASPLKVLGAGDEVDCEEVFVVTGSALLVSALDESFDSVASAPSSPQRLSEAAARRERHLEERTHSARVSSVRRSLIVESQLEKDLCKKARRQMRLDTKLEAAAKRRMSLTAETVRKAIKFAGVAASKASCASAASERRASVDAGFTLVDTASRSSSAEWEVISA